MNQVSYVMGLAFSSAQALRTNDITSLCKETTQAQLEDTIRKNFGKTIDEFKKESGQNSWFEWIASMYPDSELRLNGFLTHAILKKFDLNSIESAHEYLLHPSVLRPDRDDAMGGVFLNWLTDSSDSPFASRTNDLSSDPKLLAACNLLILGTECAKDLKNVIQLARPRSALVNDAVPSLYVEILGDSKSYDEGLRRAALKVLERVRDNDTKDADLFSDVERSFREAGNSPAQAKEMAWKTLGLLATGGANISARVFQLKTRLDSQTTKVALSVIASLAPVLDSKTFATGHPYSYPKSVHTTCDSGKPYHFWLTAYLAHALVEGGAHPAAAAAAAFTAQKGYEMFSNTPGRDPSRPFREDFQSPYADSIRMDLAYSSAGAIFGSNAINVEKDGLDINSGVKRTFMASQPSAKMSSEDAKTLAGSNGANYVFKWNSLFGSDAAFKAYMMSDQDSIALPGP